MDKMKFETPDQTDINIDKLARFFPNCVTETADADGHLHRAVKFDVLKQMLSDEIVEDGDEAYEFTWVGKRAAMREANKPTRSTLRPCKEESVNWDSTENLYIEGDNLEVLKLLQESYLNKVKMIYIDPPYNTGNDFIYNDGFKVSDDEYADEIGLYDENDNRLFKNTDTNGRFHSDWCSMIYSRLMLARNLLSDDGVIFISIDDNEQDNMKKICDEVFGQNNFISMIIVRANSRGQTYNAIAKTHEYILIYSKSANSELRELEKDLNNSDLNLNDNVGAFNIRELRNRNPKFGRHNRPALYYPIYVNPNIADKNGLSPVSLHKSNEFTIEVFPLNSTGKESCWRWGKAKFQNNNSSQTMDSNIVAKQKNSGGYNIYEKYRKTTYKPKSIWNENNFLTETGTVQLRNLNFNGEFDFPKPVDLVKRCIALSTTEDDLIIDFFSGSATTAHAVMQLNAEDGGHRKFILVQLDEKCDEKSEAYKAGYKNICEIGKERIRRAGKKIKEENPTADLDTGFRVFKLADSNMEDVYFSADEITQDIIKYMESNIKPDRTDMDLLFGCLLETGNTLSLPYYCEEISGCCVHTYGVTKEETEEILRDIAQDNKTFSIPVIACFDNDIPESVIMTIAKRKPIMAIFRDSSFSKVTEKINMWERFKWITPKTTVKVI